jgi:hypothetical protein
LLREPCSRTSVDPAKEIAVIDMPANELKPVGKAEWLMAAALIAAGTAISALSLAEIRAHPAQFAQATQPTPSTPPEPARPDPQAQKAGAQPALPPAPAEKTAPPIKEK